MKNYKIVVISKSYEAALGVARSLKLAGFIHIDLYFVGRANIAFRSNVFEAKYNYTKRNDEEIVCQLIDIYGGSKCFLFPCDDYTTSLADRFREKLESIFAYTYVDGHKSGAITHLMDKDYQTVLAKEFNLPMAKSWEIVCENGAYQIPSDMVYPCFVKPLVSANGAAKSVIGKCDSAEHLQSYLATHVKSGINFPLIVQEYIHIEEEFNIHGICDGENFILPIIHKKLATANFNKGVTVLGKNLNPCILKPQLEKLEKLLKATGYHGIFNVEMFVSKGTVYLNEINFRIAGTCWGATGANVNIPYLWIKTLMGEFGKWEPVTPKFDTVFINDKTAFEDWTKGYSNIFQFIRWNRQADYHLILCKWDSAPYKTFVKAMLKIWVGQKLFRFKKHLK